MEDWYYFSSADSEKHYYPCYDDTIFAILCIFRYSAIIKKVPDYYVYNNENLVETLYGKDLYEMYIENEEDNDSEVKDYESENNSESLHEVLEKVNGEMEKLVNNLEILNSLLKR